MKRVMIEDAFMGMATIDYGMHCLSCIAEQYVPSFDWNKDKFQFQTKDAEVVIRIMKDIINAKRTVGGSTKWERQVLSMAKIEFERIHPLFMAWIKVSQTFTTLGFIDKETGIRRDDKELYDYWIETAFSDKTLTQPKQNEK